MHDHTRFPTKTQKRTGWVDNSIPNAESISDHMHRMAILSLCSSDESLDIGRCVQLSIVHDLAEAQVGDIAPREGFTKEEKRKLEREAMNNFCDSMLHNSVAASRILSLWEEYEEQHTAEARFVKDLDRFEMACQADEYEREHSRNLQAFFDSSIPFLRHPEVVQWGQTLINERNSRAQTAIHSK